jgi:hypothetical protein
VKLIYNVNKSNKLEVLTMKKWFNRQTITAFVLGITIALSGAIFAAEELRIYENPYPILVNGSEEQVEGYNINDHTFLSLPGLAKILGIDVKFNQVTDKIEVTTAVYAQNPSITDPAPTPTLVPRIVSPKPTPRGPEDLELTVVEINGEKYVEPTIGGYFYAIGFRIDSKVDSNGNSIFMLYKKDYSKDDSDLRLIIPEIPTKKVNYGLYIDYDYYIKTLLPILKEGAK